MYREARAIYGTLWIVARTEVIHCVLLYRAKCDDYRVGSSDRKRQRRRITELRAEDPQRQPNKYYREGILDKKAKTSPTTDKTGYEKERT
ncbi:hypothetical protein Tco_0556121 [Tanacetum coccineum]